MHSYRITQCSLKNTDTLATAADPAVVSESESEGAAAGRLDSDALATVECGEAGPGDNTDSVVGESDVTQSSMHPCGQPERGGELGGVR